MLSQRSSETQCHECWLCRASGGLDAERAARAAFLEKAAAVEQRHFTQLQAVRKEGFRKVRASVLMQPASAVPTTSTITLVEGPPAQLLHCSPRAALKMPTFY